MTRLSKRGRNKLWAEVYKHPFVKKKKGGHSQRTEKTDYRKCIKQCEHSPGRGRGDQQHQSKGGNGRHIHRGGKGRGVDTMSIKEKSVKTEGMGGKPNKYAWGTRLIYETSMVPQDNDRLCGLFQAVMVERIHCEHQTRQGKSQWDGYLLISRSLNGELSGLAYRHACEESSKLW